MIKDYLGLRKATDVSMDAKGNLECSNENGEPGYDLVPLFFLLVGLDSPTNGLRFQTLRLIDVHQHSQKSIYSVLS